MKYFKMLHVAIAAIFIIVGNQTYADSASCDECGSSYTCAPTCESSCCAPSCWGRGFISAGILYLRPEQGGFAGGCIPHEINNYISSSGDVFGKIKGESKDPHFRWDPGFRIGTGYEFGRQSWDIAAFWTHFHSHLHENEHHDDFHWKLDFDVVDVVIGRNICFNSFNIRPFIGVRGAEINQKVKSNSSIAYKTFFTSGSSSSFSSSDYSSGSYDSSSDLAITDFFYAKENNKEKFKGVGPLLGLEAGWDLGCGFGVFACVSVSTLYGHYNIKFHGSDSFLNGSNSCYKKSHLHSCQFVTDAYLGVNWEQCFCNKWTVFFELAFEQHRYFNHNRLGDYGDLCLDGVSLSAGISF
ncbi:MAG: Lpg1974 family pore-forming outer membrane protein [Parachlamydiaceae bacterium]|nr:Lpg1974 family pore-forming outer membrane protein [Parachlamydiaceae bacterium]